MTNNVYFHDQDVVFELEWYPTMALVTLTQGDTSLQVMLQNQEQRDQLRAALDKMEFDCSYVQPGQHTPFTKLKDLNPRHLYFIGNWALQCNTPENPMRWSLTDEADKVLAHISISKMGGKTIQHLINKARKNTYRG